MFCSSRLFPVFIIDLQGFTFSANGGNFRIRGRTLPLLIPWPDSIWITVLVCQSFFDVLIDVSLSSDFPGIDFLCHNAPFEEYKLCYNGSGRLAPNISSSSQVLHHMIDIIFPSKYQRQSNDRWHFSLESVGSISIRLLQPMAESMLEAFKQQKTRILDS